jgi:hypothetical protein
MCAIAVALAIVNAPEARAHAADPSNEAGTAAAESLFQEARRLSDAKKFSDACPKFLASHKLSPAVGTLLNLADCYEKNGQVASAWARFREATALAQRLNRPEREKVARERAEKLEPRLVRITINSRDKNAQVTLDGVEIDTAVLGTALPVDPGKHTIEAKAPGKKTFTTSVETAERTKNAPVVDVPALEDEAEGAAPPTPTPTATSTPTPTAPPPPPPTPARTIETPNNGEALLTSQKLIGIGVGAVGVVAIGVGAIFGLRTQSKWADAVTRCSARFECDATGVGLASDAKTSGTISTVAFVAGGLLATAGAVLFFTAPAQPVRIGVGPRSVAVGGTF